MSGREELFLAMAIALVWSVPVLLIVRKHCDVEGWFVGLRRVKTEDFSPVEPVDATKARELSLAVRESAAIELAMQTVFREVLSAAGKGRCECEADLNDLNLSDQDLDAVRRRLRSLGYMFAEVWIGTSSRRAIERHKRILSLRWIKPLSQASRRAGIDSAN